MAGSPVWNFIVKMTERELLTLKGSYKPQAKFRNIPASVDGFKFDSRAEARRYGELRMLERAKQISGLVLQPQFPILVCGQLMCTYIADFSYTENGNKVVEDVKSKATKTPIYRLKKKLMLALHGIEIRETA